MMNWKCKQNASYCLPLFTGQPLHQHIAVIDCVLPFACRNHSTNITCCAFAWEIRLVHHDFRYIQVHQCQ